VENSVENAMRRVGMLTNRVETGGNVTICCNISCGKAQI